MYAGTKLTIMIFSLLKRLTAETQPAMSTVMVPGQAPHVNDVGEDGVGETPLDELWTVKQRLDLVSTGMSII